MNKKLVLFFMVIVMVALTLSQSSARSNPYDPVIPIDDNGPHVCDNHLDQPSFIEPDPASITPVQPIVPPVVIAPPAGPGFVQRACDAIDEVGDRICRCIDQTGYGSDFYWWYFHPLHWRD